LREALAQVEARDQTIAALRQQIAEQQSELAAARRAMAQLEEARRNADATAEARIERHRHELALARAELAELRIDRAPHAHVVPPRPVVVPARIKVSQVATRAKAAAPVEDEEEPVQWWLSSEAKAKPTVKRRKA
jgi:multidrug efflux pump subunit AcrA (membrane-fusion protein)